MIIPFQIFYRLRYTSLLWSRRRRGRFGWSRFFGRCRLCRLARALDVNVSDLYRVLRAAVGIRAWCASLAGHARDFLHQLNGVGIALTKNCIATVIRLAGTATDHAAVGFETRIEERQILFRDEE